MDSDSKEKWRRVVLKGNYKGIRMDGIDGNEGRKLDRETNV